MFADVIVDIQHEKLDKIFQYRIPERLKDELHPGMEVIIPFGKGNRQIKGYVTSLSETCNYDLSKVKATTISYLLAQIGLGEIKAENVKTLLDKISASGKFELLDKTCDVERGDILFWLWSGNIMKESSFKHVGIAEHPSTGNTIYCLGGNQKDKICTLAYDRKYLFCIARLKEV